MIAIAVGSMLVVGTPASVHAGAHRVETAAAACALTKKRMAARGRFPISAIALCDTIGAADSPKGYFVIGLHSTRECEGICSTLMGWFSVQKSTGRVFEWDVENGRGRLVQAKAGK